LGQNFSGSTLLEHIFIGMDPPNHLGFRSRTYTEKPLTLQEGKGLVEGLKISTLTLTLLTLTLDPRGVIQPLPITSAAKQQD
jgi:hypothetical protein